MSLVTEASLVVAGAVIFACGLGLANRSLASILDHQIKVAMGLFACSRATALPLGATLPFVFYSPNTTAAAASRMNSLGLLSLSNALGIMLALAVGHSLWIGFLAFRLAGASVYMIAVALALWTFSSGAVARRWARVLLGVGLVFFGLYLAKTSLDNIFTAGVFAGPMTLVERLEGNPFHLFLGGIVMAALVRSPVVCVGLALAMGFHLEGNVALFLGATVGAALPALPGALVARNAHAARIAVGHILMSLCGSVFFMAQLERFSGFAMRTGYAVGVRSTPHMTAVAYTLYALFQAVIFLPLLPAIAEIVLTITGGGRKGGKTSEAWLDDLDEPPKALERSRDGVVATGRKALVQLRGCLSSFLVDTAGATERARRIDDDIKAYSVVLADYTGRIDEAGLSRDSRRTKTMLLTAIEDVRLMSSLVADELAPLADFKTRRKLDFSTHQAHRFEELYRRVADDFAEALDLIEGRPARLDKLLESRRSTGALSWEIIRTPGPPTRVPDARKDAQKVFFDAVRALGRISAHVCDLSEVLAD